MDEQSDGWTEKPTDCDGKAPAIVTQTFVQVDTSMNDESDREKN